MPNRNKTGPRGRGPMTGRQMGTCKGARPSRARPRIGLGRGLGRRFVGRRR